MSEKLPDLATWKELAIIFGLALAFFIASQLLPEPIGWAPVGN